jgi:acetyl esterase/lipase
MTRRASISRRLGRRSLALLAAALAAVALGACRYLDPEYGYAVTTDIVYGDAINEDGALEQLELDLYLPTNDTATDRPAVIWAHGGGFVQGDKASGASWAREFARRGYVAASINYRMDEDAGGVTVPLDTYELERISWAVSDMKASVRWFRANAATLGIDPGRIAVGGASAGAVTSLSVAVTADDPGDTGDHTAFSNAVCTAISVSGASDPAMVDASDAGAIFFHGDQDTVVPYALAVATRDAMQAAGLPTRFHTYEGAGHGLASTFRADMQAKTYPWLLQHLVNAPDPCL